MIFDDEREDFELLGYFSLAIKQIVLTPEISKSQFKKIGARPADRSVKAFLIGQLGKNSNIPDNPIDLALIFEIAFNKIETARREIGGRTVILECENIDTLVKLYEKNGFRLIETENGENDLVTMYAILK